MKPPIAPEMVAVIPRPGHTIRIVFADGEVRDVDITHLLSTPAFSPLRDVAMFEQVGVDEQTGTVTWPGNLDLDPDVIYNALDLGPNKARIQVLAPSIARERGVSVATVVREAIDRGVSNPAAQRRAAGRRLLDATDMPVPDPSDLRAELEVLRGRRA
jgi:Protein of unknown function (DUF2442)